jgi:hypothetical protein
VEHKYLTWGFRYSTLPTKRFCSNESWRTTRPVYWEVLIVRPLRASSVISLRLRRNSQELPAAPQRIRPRAQRSGYQQRARSSPLWGTSASPRMRHPAGTRQRAPCDKQYKRPHLRAWRRNSNSDTGDSGSSRHISQSLGHVSWDVGDQDFLRAVASPPLRSSPCTAIMLQSICQSKEV